MSDSERLTFWGVVWATICIPIFLALLALLVFGPWIAPAILVHFHQTRWWWTLVALDPFTIATCFTIVHFIDDHID